MGAPVGLQRSVRAAPRGGWATAEDWAREEVAGPAGRAGMGGRCGSRGGGEGGAGWLTLRGPGGRDSMARVSRPRRGPSLAGRAARGRGARCPGGSGL